jgi:hypothetical protein
MNNLPYGLLIVGFNIVWTRIIHNAMRIVGLRGYAVAVPASVVIERQFAGHDI